MQALTEDVSVQSSSGPSGPSAGRPKPPNIRQSGLWLAAVAPRHSKEAQATDERSKSVVEPSKPPPLPRASKKWQAMVTRTSVDRTSKPSWKNSSLTAEIEDMGGRASIATLSEEARHAARLLAVSRFQREQDQQASVHPAGSHSV